MLTGKSAFGSDADVNHEVLCDHAGDGEVLINRRVFVDIEKTEKAVPMGALELKGFKKPVEVFRLASEDSDPKVVKPAFGKKKS